jgi:ABC-2 type transport system permease protein
MPDWLQTLVLSVPFAQAIAVPVSLLTGITPLDQVLQVWLSQLAWVAGMGLFSALFFRVAVRKVTVQGG